MLRSFRPKRARQPSDASVGPTNARLRIEEAQQRRPRLVERRSGPMQVKALNVLANRWDRISGSLDSHVSGPVRP
jgi:hypothetical protein